jgi:hypothetical protein
MSFQDMRAIFEVERELRGNSAVTNQAFAFFHGKCSWLSGF